MDLQDVIRFYPEPDSSSFVSKSTMIWEYPEFYSLFTTEEEAKKFIDSVILHLLLNE